MSTGRSRATRVLFVYYSFSDQARRVGTTMTDALRADGCEVTEAALGFTDRKYSRDFHRFPLNRPFWDVLRMLPAQLRRATGQIEIPPEAAVGGYDRVIVGSPTWWLTTNMPVRSYLKSPEARTVLAGTPFSSYVVCRRYWGNNHRTVKTLGTQAGGRYREGVHFAYEGGQIRSLLSLISYLGAGENRPRFLGVKIPPTNLQPDYEGEADAFAHRLTASLTPTPEI